MRDFTYVRRRSLHFYDEKRCVHNSQFCSQNLAIKSTAPEDVRSVCARSRCCRLVAREFLNNISSQWMTWCADCWCVIKKPFVHHRQLYRACTCKQPRKHRILGKGVSTLQQTSSQFMKFRLRRLAKLTLRFSFLRTSHVSNVLRPMQRQRRSPKIWSQVKFGTPQIVILKFGVHNYIMNIVLFGYNVFSGGFSQIHVKYYAFVTFPFFSRPY